jgi:AraC-like DNA-binding protein
LCRQRYPLHYVKRLKLTMAADMLANGGLRVTEAAQRTGYAMASRI